MVRFIFVMIYLVITLILYIPIGLMALLVGVFSPKARDGIIKGVFNFAFSVIHFLSGAKVTYKGLEKIPKDCAVLYVANHASFFDVILLSPKFPSLTGYVAKKSFSKIPLLAQAMKMTHTLFLDREDIKQGLKTILAAIEQVKAGISMIIFPEGTRSKDGNMAEFKEGSMKISIKSGCPIVPVAISNTAEIWENHFPKLTPVGVIIEFLDPIDPKSVDADTKKHLGKMCHDLIEEARDKNLQEIYNSGII